ncbi:hypothetical protein [Evansella tamaricis]|uniref:Uncharacterized protein n=1 Tax=Evansella tamaricis TaxID=2069301 RepID=A0ABS6JHJ1_9BACI|nr:hypothetical protein [Evansella tamaricis]MBU9712327.1 hypothetical protein [Evansella tamaricis]
MDDRKIEYHITVENIDIKDPVLESLTFQLDSVDVKELSGALNLGNNFGTSVNQKEKKDPKDKEEEKKKIEMEEKEKNAPNTIMTPSKKGFSFKFNK